MRISLFCTYLSNKYVFKWVHKVQLTKLNSKGFALNEMFQRNASKLAILGRSLAGQLIGAQLIGVN